jgi:RNA polymerase sigma-70 factor, ECF subfamily
MDVLLTDEQLYVKIRQGDQRAFDLLYSRYERPLFRFIYRFLKNSEEAEEVFHEAFIKVFNTKEIQFDKGSFRGWVYLVSRNMCLNKIRSKKRGDKALKLIKDTDPEYAQPDMVEEKDIKEKVKEKIQTLPTTMQDLFHLRASGLNTKEMAQTLNIPQGTVKSRMHTMVGLLKKEFQNAL